jgi:hypothetical protein
LFKLHERSSQIGQEKAITHQQTQHSKDAAMNLGDDDLRLLCVIETEVFPIDVEGPSWCNPKFIVGNLKEKIQKKRNNDSLASYKSD